MVAAAGRRGKAVEDLFGPITVAGAKVRCGGAAGASRAG
jgi:hypothetical protein